MLFGCSTVRTLNDGLCIGNNLVYLVQKLYRCLRIFTNDFVMTHIPPFSGSYIASPRISTNSLKEALRFFSSCSLAKSLHETLNGAGRSIVNYLHMRKTRSFFTSLISIKEYGKQSRARSFAPTLHRGAFGSEKRIVQLYQLNEAVFRIPIGHSLAYLMGRQPRRLTISYFQDPLHLGYRHPYFIHRHMIDQRIACDQRAAALMEYGACRQAHFCSTPLEIQLLSRADETCFVISASGALESLRPSYFSQMRRASFFSRELFLKLKQAPFSVPFGMAKPSARGHTSFMN